MPLRQFGKEAYLRGLYWIKSVAGQKKSCIGFGWTFTIAAAAYNLVRYRDFWRRGIGVLAAFQSDRALASSKPIWDRGYVALCGPRQDYR
ncbi:hypothetical protein X757_31700 [Mesorhizobium sp. LSHC414A00]|nr:hypothetical protein X757_31700 [Mesorhizobium sp. LSHC414A00]